MSSGPGVESDYAYAVDERDNALLTPLTVILAYLGEKRWPLDDYTKLWRTAADELYTVFTDFKMFGGSQIRVPTSALRLLAGAGALGRDQTIDFLLKGLAKVAQAREPGTTKDGGYELLTAAGADFLQAYRFGWS